MTGTIYTGSYATGITLNNPSTQNPATIAASGTAGSSGNATGLYGYPLNLGGTAFTITNYGLVIGSDQAVRLAAGGTFTNQVSAGVTSGYIGILITSAPGSVSNSGQIVSTGNGAAIDFRDGGVVTNSAAVAAVYDGVAIRNATGMVVNSGTVGVAGSTLHARGVYLGAGGSVTNSAGGMISVTANFPGGAAVYSTGLAAGISIAGGGSVVNDGSIAASGTWHPAGGNRAYNIGEGVILTGGGGMTNASTASVTALFAAVDITGAGSVVNAGMLIGTVAYGVTLRSAGSVTNSLNGTISGGFDGIRAINAAATVINDGLVTGPQNYGVRLGVNGAITNSASGRITGGSEGILFNLGGAYLNNAGTVSGAGTYRTTIGSGAFLGGGGTVTNSGTGLIAGRLDGLFLNGAGSVGNSGTITGTASYGVRVTGGGMVSNSGVINGGSIGVNLAGTAAATLSNAGAIAGSTGDAVLFGSGNDSLILAPGYSFSGDVDGGAGTNTLELTAGVATVSGLGSVITNFGSIVLDPGASWLVQGNTVGLGGTISGFAATDTIDLTGLHETVLNYVGGALTLTGDASVTLSLPGSFTTQSFNTTTDAAGTGTSLTLACFAEGTRIQTESGLTAVEDLTVGDRVTTLDGTIQPVVWLGRRVVDCATHRRPETVWPIRVARGAFGGNVPVRDLYLSPDHAVFVNNVLVPVKLLINETTIAQVERSKVTYYHVELDRHEVILAERLPVESYLDLGDRANFTPADGESRRFPESVTRLLPDAAAMWEACGAAPLVVAGEALARARRQTVPHVSREPWRFGSAIAS